MMKALTCGILPTILGNFYGETVTLNELIVLDRSVLQISYRLLKYW